MSTTTLTRPRNGTFPSVPNAGPIAPSPRGSIPVANRPTSIPSPNSGVPRRAPTPSTTGWAPPAPGYRPIPGVPGAYRNPTTGAPAWGRNLAQEAAENAGIARQAAQDRASGAAARAAARNNSLANAGRPRRIPISGGILGRGLGALNTLGNLITVGELLGWGINAFICSQQPLSPSCNPSGDPFFDGVPNWSPGQSDTQYVVDYSITYEYGDDTPTETRYSYGKIGRGPFSERRSSDGVQHFIYDGNGNLFLTHIVINTLVRGTITLINVRRLDGLPENDINPEVIPSPNPIPEDRHPIPTPRPRPTPRPTPTPEPRPQPGFDPDGNPSTEPQPTPVPPVQPRPIPRPRPRPTPEPRRSPDPPTPEPQAPEPSNCCNQSVDLLNRVIQLLTQAYEGAIIRSDCEGNSLTPYPWSGEGLQGINMALQTIGALVADTSKEIICDDSKTVVMPESWDLQADKFRPQLSISYQIDGNSRQQRAININHYRYGNEPDRAIGLSAYTRGDYRCTLHLSDGSHIICNASSEVEGRRVLQELSRLVHPSRLAREGNGLKIRVTKTSQGIREVQAVPTRIVYYSSGQRDLQPDWSRDYQS